MNGMNIRNNHQVIHPAIQARVEFFEQLVDEVKKASNENEISIVYAKFCNFCTNLKIVHAFSNTSFGNLISIEEYTTEELRKELLADIDMAKNVCLSTRDSLSSKSSVTINNTNQQEQNLSISFELTECLRKVLTGEQYDELIELVQQKADKRTLSDKIKDFGIDVASGILAGIISSQMMR